MSIKSAAFALTLALAFAGVAEAKEQVVSAALAAPVATKTRVVADHAIWLCQDNACAARLADRATVRGCRDLAAKVGAVQSYGPLSAEDLARCNGASAGASIGAPDPQASR